MEERVTFAEQRVRCDSYAAVVWRTRYVVVTMSALAAPLRYQRRATFVVERRSGRLMLACFSVAPDWIAGRPVDRRQHKGIGFSGGELSVGRRDAWR